MEPGKPIDGNAVQGPFDNYKRRFVQHIKAIRMDVPFFVVNHQSHGRQHGKAGDWMYFGPAGERYIATDDEFNRLWEITEGTGGLKFDVAAAEPEPVVAREEAQEEMPGPETTDPA